MTDTEPPTSATWDLLTETLSGQLMYRVVAEGPSGDVSYPAVNSEEVARDQMARLQISDPTAGKYDRWFIVQFEPINRLSVVHREWAR